MLENRKFAIPDDVKRLAVPVLAHRIVCRGLVREGQREAGADHRAANPAEDARARLKKCVRHVPLWVGSCRKMRGRFPKSALGEFRAFLL